MKIQNHLTMANRCLAELRKLPLPGNVSEASLQAYRNGRENGYVVTFWGRHAGTSAAFAFAENRNSDDLVVYPATGHWGDLTDDDYAAKRFFNAPSYRTRLGWDGACYYGEAFYAAAARYIVTEARRRISAQRRAS